MFPIPAGSSDDDADRTAFRSRVLARAAAAAVRAQLGVHAHAATHEPLAAAALDLATTGSVCVQPTGTVINFVRLASSVVVDGAPRGIHFSFLRQLRTVLDAAGDLWACSTVDEKVEFSGAVAEFILEDDDVSAKELDTTPLGMNVRGCGSTKTVPDVPLTRASAVHDDAYGTGKLAGKGGAAGESW